MPTATDLGPRHGWSVARDNTLPAIDAGDPLGRLIAEFERSGIAELRLAAPDFTLVLQAGALPRIEQVQ